MKKSPITQLTGLLALCLALTLFNGCGSKESVSAALPDASQSSSSSDFAPHDNTAEVEEYYQTKVVIPTSEFEALQRGEITQEEIDARKAAGEYPKFFRFATLEDIPGDIEWEDGMDLPEIGSSKAKKGGTRYGRIQDFPRTLRIVGPDSNGSFRTYILDDVWLTFCKRHPNVTKIGPNGHYYMPYLADRWAVDKENKTVYVHLNPKATWSDGVPITVDDVFFMFFMYQSEYIRAPWYNNWYNRNYTNVTRYDDHTFSISVPEAKPDMNSRVLELNVMPRHFYKELGDDYVDRYQWRFVPTPGAYVVNPEDIQKGQSITLTRNENWWAKDNKFLRYRYNYDKIRLTVVRDTAKSFEMFKKGELDGFGMNLPEYNYDKFPDDIEQVARGYVEKYVFYNDVPRPTYGLWINESKPLLDNREVRIGINYATNWQLVIDQYFRGDYTRMNTSSDGYGEFTHPTLKSRPFDIEKALAHFEKAGFTERDNDGILKNAAGQRLSFTLTTGYEVLKDIMTILKQEAEKAGLELRVEVLDGTTAWKKVQEKKHDIQFSAFNVSPEMYPRYWETYHSVNAYDRAFLEDGSVNPDRKVKTQTNNLQVIAIPELDKRIEQYRASEDAREMMRLAFEMEEILHEDASFVPGFYLPFYRVAYWRWIHFPDDFNVKLSRYPGEYFLGWIDTEERLETLKGRKKGISFEPSIKVFDQYRIVKD